MAGIIPCFTKICHMQDTSESDGFEEGHYQKLCLSQHNQEPVKVLAEVCNGYFDVELWDHTVVPALCWFHLKDFSPDGPV